MEDLKKQHRDFVHSTIVRMNTNSFQIKGLVITLVAAFLGVFGSSSNILFVYIPLPFIIISYLLDAYYLQLERKFRGIYEDICDLTTDDCKKTFSIYEMKPKLYSGGRYNYFKVLFSLQLILLYWCLIISLISVIFYKSYFS